jgi:predicted dehydrogenase
MIRIGLTGCGFIGAVHSYTLKALSEARVVDAAVVAVYDRDRGRAERFARAHRDADVAGDEQALLDAVDVVWVCTWTAGHLAVVEAAADRGVAVFCEKPLAPTLADSQRLVAAARRVPNQVGLVLRHAPVFQACADAVASGRYGRPMAAVLRDDQYFPNQGQYRSTWRADVAAAGGGALIEHSIHDVDVLTWILGPARSVTATTSCFAGHEGIEDVAVVTTEHTTGARSSLVSIWHEVLTRPSTRRLEIFCERALLWTEDDYLGPLHVETSDGEQTTTGEEPAWLDALRLPAAVAKDLRQYAVPNRAFLDALATGSKACPSVDIALAAHETVDGAYQSAASGGRPVEIRVRS